MLLKKITKVTARILPILFERRASLSTIARESKTTKANVLHSLRKLEQDDVVRKEVQGRTHLYRFNYLHPHAKEMVRLFVNEEQTNYDLKLGGLPQLFHQLLKNILKQKYQGSIFFGSSVYGKYKDIDVFILTTGVKASVLQQKMRWLDPRLSLIVGSEQELSHGIQSQDMLYRNIIRGVPFGGEETIITLRNKPEYSRREDIVERFILGYRELLNCREFTEPEYVKSHWEKGTTDIMYALLNYLDLFPLQDAQARKMFKKHLKIQWSKDIKKALSQALLLGRRLL